jgi:hypothetical protein
MSCPDGHGYGRIHDHDNDHPQSFHDMKGTDRQTKVKAGECDGMRALRSLACLWTTIRARFDVQETGVCIVQENFTGSVFYEGIEVAYGRASGLLSQVASRFVLSSFLPFSRPVVLRGSEVNDPGRLVSFQLA